MKKTSIAVFLFMMTLGFRIGHAQNLVPRAYLILPLHSNAITLTYTFNNGSILFDPSLPITNASGTLHTGVFNYYHSLNIFGRSANILAVSPYTAGHFQGEVLGSEQKIYRSGLMDAAVRFSVNLKGGPAMSMKDFAAWRQKTLLGASLFIMAPTGQYDSSKLINPGTNRWAFKPEFGVSQRWDHWIVDGYAGIWFFTTNNNFLSNTQASPTTNTLKQNSIIATEAHVSYDLKLGTWISFDWNYWRGGQTSVNGVLKVSSLLSNSRIGATTAFRISKHQSLKFSFSNGAIIRVGGNFQTYSLAWQYSWLGKPN